MPDLSPGDPVLVYAKSVCGRGSGIVAGGRVSSVTGTSLRLDDVNHVVWGQRLKYDDDGFTWRPSSDGVVTAARAVARLKVEEPKDE